MYFDIITDENQRLLPVSLNMVNLFLFLFFVFFIRETIVCWLPRLHHECLGYTEGGSIKISCLVFSYLLILVLTVCKVIIIANDLGSS